MKYLTRELNDEHALITLMLEILTKVAAKLKKGDDVDKSHLVKIVNFLIVYADRCHHGKEEHILFPKIPLSKKNNKLVTELIAEHKTGRDYVRGMKESLSNYAPGNSDAVHIAINAQEYIKLLTEHIGKEGIILFPVMIKKYQKKCKKN